ERTGTGPSSSRSSSHGPGRATRTIPSRPGATFARTAPTNDAPRSLLGTIFHVLALVARARLAGLARPVQHLCNLGVGCGRVGLQHLLHRLDAGEVALLQALQPALLPVLHHLRVGAGQLNVWVKAALQYAPIPLGDAHLVLGPRLGVGRLD